jgi:hypothetical protein
MMGLFWHFNIWIYLLYINVIVKICWVGSEIGSFIGRSTPCWKQEIIVGWRKAQGLTG